MPNNNHLSRTPTLLQDEGIVTLADKHFFPGLVLLYESIQNSYPVPVTCFDAGLTGQQKKWAHEHLSNCTITPIPPDKDIERVFESLSGKSENNTQESMLWICPFLIKNSPYRRVLWLDSDLIVLRNLSQLFAHIDDGPVFTVENRTPAATANHPSLTALLPLKQQHTTTIPIVNAGVSGWDINRDAALIQDYIKPVLRACKDERIRRMISWHGQGCLIWAIQNLGLQHRILSDRNWNLCARHAEHGIDEIDMLTLNTELKSAYPDTNIVHWNGFPLEQKLFSRLGTEAELLASFLKRQPGIHYDVGDPKYRHDRIHLISHVSSASSLALIHHFITYYQKMKVDNFLIILHEVDKNAHLAKAVLAEYGIVPIMYVNDYSALLKAKRVETIKKKYVSENDWVVYVDIDEFQVYPDTLMRTLAQCDRSGYKILTGKFIDRIAKNGELNEIKSQPSIWEQFPYCADIATEITGAWNRKICAAKGAIPLNYSGSHHMDYGCNTPREYQTSYLDPRIHPANIEIHHFKWDASLNIRLKNKLSGKGGDKDSIHGLNFIGEYHSLYAHLAENRRISVTDSTLAKEMIPAVREQGLAAKK